MEPCLFRHGKSDVVKALPTEEGASMEPCLFRHGKMSYELTNEGFRAASMEPCLFRHGKSGRSWHKSLLSCGFNGAMSFQTW